MKMKKWTSVQASGNGGGVRVPAGGYVFMCTGVEDVPSREYLRLTYDIAEGEYKGAFSQGYAADNEWTHQFTVSYSERAEGLFKRLLECLEASNPSFNVAAWEQTSNEQAFVGKLFGAAVGNEKYTNQKGEDKERWTLPSWWTVEDIRGGHFTCPADKDNRTAKQETTTVPTSVYDESIPF